MWYNHPTIRPYHQEVVSFFRELAKRQLKSRPLVFVCGGYESDRRQQIEDYLSKQHPEVLAFRAESIWESISKKDESALQMENELAELSDMVIIVVESAGTIAELGAFATSEKLRPRLMLILNRERKDEESFINTGPVRWVEKASNFTPIYADFDIILKSSGALSSNIQSVSTKLRRESWNTSLTPKKRLALFLLADIVGVIGPASHHDIKHVYVTALEDQGTNLGSLIALAVAVGLTKKFKHNGDTFYYRPLEKDRIASSFLTYSGDLSHIRSRILSPAIALETFREVLRKVSVA